jgi:hypothetical protein
MATKNILGRLAFVLFRLGRKTLGPWTRTQDPYGRGPKGYPPENAETPANRVGRVEQLLFQFLEKVFKPLENTFAMVRKKN